MQMSYHSDLFFLGWVLSLVLKKKIPGDSDVKPGLRPPLIDGEPEISTQLSGSQATQF